MMKFKVLLLSFFISISAFSAFSSGQKMELNKKVYKTELFLKRIIGRDLASMLSSREVLVSVDIAVNEQAIFNEVVGLDDKWSDVKTMQLPGFFIESGAQEPLKEIKNITEENILSNIKDLKVKVIVTAEDIDLERVKELTEQVVSSNYGRADKVNLTVEAARSNSAIVPAAKPDFFTQFKQTFPYLLGAILFALILVLGFYIISLNFKKTMRDLSEVISKKDLGGSISIKPSAMLGNEDRKKSPLLDGGGSSLDVIDKYYELLEKIQSALSSNYEVVAQMISFNFHLEEYEKIMVLMEVVPSEKREEVYSKLPKASIKKFKDFLIFNGDDLYNNGTRLLEAAKHIVKMISLSAINSENFYSYYLKEMSSSLDAAEIGSVINELDINELMYFIEFVDKPSLGFAMTKCDFDSEKLGQDYKALTQDEVKDCVTKISNILMKNTHGKEVDPRKSILPFLPKEMEDVVLNKLDIKDGHSFASLVKNQTDKVIGFLKESDYEETVAALALFSESDRDSLISKMPEIVGERLRKEKFVLSKESLMAKSRLLSRLESGHAETEEIA